MANTKDTTSTYTPSSTSSSKFGIFAMKAPRHRKVKLFKLYKFVDTTYREIRKYIPGLEMASLNDNLIMECINNYKKCFLEIYEKEDALEYFEVCGELAQNISRTLDLFNEISAIYTNMDEYYHRVCELLSIFIACELRLSVDSDDDLSLISSRIIFIIKRHLTQEDEDATRYNILLTLVYIPRLFNARQIVCNIFEEFVPLKSPTGAAAGLSDKMYILYIIVYYRWMSMKTQDDEKKHIIDMAEMFIKPVVSLCNNQLYVPYLPAYTTHRTATRTILCNLKSYQDLRTASIIDNAYKKLGAIVNLCDDDDVIVIDNAQETLSFAEIFAAVQLQPSKSATFTIKHETNTIIDSVDLTVDDETDSSECSIVIQYEKWLHNFQVMTKQFRESEIRLQQQNENRTGKVISLDSDDSSSCEEEKIKCQAKSPTKQRTKGDKPSNAKAAAGSKQKNSFGDNNQTEDLFTDNYPLTVTPIHCNADLESSEVEDAEDVTKLSSRILQIPLQTYESKKSASSRSVIRESFHNTQNNEDERTTNKPRRDKHIHFSITPVGPTSANSKKPVSLSQPTNVSAESSEFNRFGVFGRYPLFSSHVGSTAKNEQGHMTEASTLFCNIFDRSQNSCGIFPSVTSTHFSGGDLFSSTSGRLSHSLVSPAGGFVDAHHKKRNKIHGLMQRRATLSCRSDFDDYMAALNTTRDAGNNDKFKRHPGHAAFGHQFPQSPAKSSVCSEVSNEPGIEPVPASSTSDYIINRYQFQDEKLMKNCAVVIEPTAELIEYERKRDAMYNELLQKQRRKMELRAIEKLKEKERRRQEKEMKRDQFLREQRETMEKLQRMKINSPFNEIGSSDKNPNVGSDKQFVSEISRLNKDTTKDNELQETTEIEQQPSDLNSSDTDLIPLQERIKRTTQSSRIRKRRQSAIESLITTKQQPIGTRRSVEVQNYSEKFLASQNSGGRKTTTQQAITGSTESQVEPVRAPSRTKRERKKSLCSNKYEEETDLEMEYESYKHVEVNSMPRQSPRLQRNMEMENNTDSETDKTTSLKLPRPVRGRPRIEKKSNTMNPSKSNSDVNKITKKLDIDQTISKPESKENEATLSERTIVASIAERLYSPATIVVDKPLATSEQEEILETLEDLLGKESRLPKTTVASDESSSICRRSPLNVISTVKMVSVAETSPDLEVIENIVINEIQREMDANREQVKERTTSSCAFQTIITDVNDKSSIDAARPHENQTYYENKHFRSNTKRENSPCKSVENVNKSEAVQHLQDMLRTSLQGLPPLSATMPIAAEHSTRPLFISRVESLNRLEERHALSPVIESRQPSILVTENILLSNGNVFLETSKTLDDNHMLPPLTSSLLTEVETSIIQADISDISPTSINIVIPTVEEDAAMPHNIDERTPVVGKVMDENQNNKIARMVTGKNGDENLLLASNNNGEEETEVVSPPYESLRVSSDDDADKHSTTTDESKSNVMAGSNTSEGDHCARLTSGDNEKLDTEIQSPSYEPLHVSSDDDEKKKSEVPNETSSKVNVVYENINESPRIPFKTKGSLKFPTTKQCKIKLKRLYLSHNNISSENHDSFTPELEDDDNVSPIPSPSLDQEDCIIGSEDYNESSSHFLPSPEAVGYDNSLEAVNYRQSPFLEEDQRVIIETYEENPHPLPTILKSSTSPKPKATPKTVTFNPLAEVIPITPNRHYRNSCISERNETPPPEDFYRDHNYDRNCNNYQQDIKFITPATRKHFNDECYSNISTTEELCDSPSSSSSEESEDDDEEIGIVLASSKGQEDIRRKNVQLQRVLLVPPNAISTLSKNTSPEHDKVSVENVELLSQEKTTSQESNGGGMQGNVYSANDLLPINILSDEVRDIPASNQQQCIDEGRNVLVSTTYLSNSTTPGSYLVVNTVQNSMMSPSEHEVTSTQETIYQKSSNGSTIESNFLTSVACSVPVEEKSSSTNIQNNQVDTTNHSPDICFGSSSTNDRHTAPHMSTSTNESTKANDILASDISGANEYCDRLSPSTTTDLSIPGELEKAKETRKIQHNSSKLKHLNPFIVRTAKSSQKIPNSSRRQHTKQSPNLDKIENNSTSNSLELENSNILSSVTIESQKPDKKCIEPLNQENCTTVSNNASDSLAAATKVDSLPKKKFVLIRPKPYNIQNPSTCADDTQPHLEKPSVLVDNDEVSVQNSGKTKKFVLIRPKAIDLQSPSPTTVQQATKRNTSDHIDKPVSKKIKRNLDVIDFQEFSYSPPKDVDANTGESLGSNNTITCELQTMVNELLSQETNDEKHETETRLDIENSTNIINKKYDAEVKDSKTKTKCKDNVDDLLKRNLDMNYSENNHADMEESKRKVNRQDEAAELENDKIEIKCNGTNEIEDYKKELKRKHETGITHTKRKSNGRHHERMEPPTKERRIKEKTNDMKTDISQKEQDSNAKDHKEIGKIRDKTNDIKTDKSQTVEDSNAKDHKEIEGAEQDSKSKYRKKDADKTVREGSKGSKINTNQRHEPKMKNPKQNNIEDTKKGRQGIKYTKEKSKQNEEIRKKTKINTRNDIGAAKEEEGNRDAKRKDKTGDIEITKTAVKHKDKVVMAKDNQNMKDRNRSDREKYNTEVECSKKSKLEIIDSKREKMKIDDSKKEVKQKNALETDPLKVDDTSKETIKRPHIHRVKELPRNEEGVPNKNGDQKDKSKKIRKGRRKLEIADTNIAKTSTRTVHKAKNNLEANINLSTRSNTIIAVKMIPFTAVRVETVDFCEDTMDVRKETEVVKTTNEIIGVKMVRSATPVVQKSKHISNSIENNTEETKKLNRNINSINKAATDCGNIHISSSKSGTTSASTSKHTPNTSTKDPILYSIKNSISTESPANQANKADTPDTIMVNSSSTSAATVHARKRRKTNM